MKSVNYIWLGNNQIFESFASNFKGFIQKNPDYHPCLYVNSELSQGNREELEKLKIEVKRDESVFELMDEKTLNFYKVCIEQTNYGAASDILRIYILIHSFRDLKHECTIYLDVDVTYEKEYEVDFSTYAPLAFNYLKDQNFPNNDIIICCDELGVKLLQNFSNFIENRLSKSLSQLLTEDEQYFGNEKNIIYENIKSSSEIRILTFLTRELTIRSTGPRALASFLLSTDEKKIKFIPCRRNSESNAPIEDIVFSSNLAATWYESFHDSLYSIHKDKVLEQCILQMEEFDRLIENTSISTTSLTIEEHIGRPLKEVMAPNKLTNIYDRKITNLENLLPVLEKCQTSKDGNYLPGPELAFRRAAAVGNWRFMEIIMENVPDVDINQPGPDSGKTALDFAKERGHLMVVEKLSLLINIPKFKP